MDFYELGEDRVVRTVSTVTPNALKILWRDPLRYGVVVSTVFLGMSTGRDETNRPLVFEGMIFGDLEIPKVIRSATYQEALKAHHDLVSSASKEIATARIGVYTTPMELGMTIRGQVRRNIELFCWENRLELEWQEDKGWLESAVFIKIRSLRKDLIKDLESWFESVATGDSE